jgi:hypothetical protein
MCSVSLNSVLFHPSGSLTRSGVVAAGGVEPTIPSIVVTPSSEQLNPSSVSSRSKAVREEVRYSTHFVSQR